MIRIIDKNIDGESVLNRQITSYPEYEEKVKAIIDDVCKNGDKALFKYGEMFDGVKLTSLIVSESEIEEAFKIVDSDFIRILKKAKENIEFYHKSQLRSGFEIKKEDGIILGQKITPIERAGIYVPGGSAAYPSTVLMNAIPAKLAGVKRTIMTTPPQKGSGKIKPEILVAAKLCGVDTVIKCGGAQAIAALSFGTESVPKVDKIVGPGNIYVALAKKHVFGRVGIDMIAGPSEILIIADETGDEKLISCDLLSQAEHDRLASAVLVTSSSSLALKVRDELEKQLARLERQDIARESIDTNGKIIVADSIEKAIEIANRIAPEHLELCVEDPFKYLDKIENAGSVFLGKYSPEPLGDYFAGPNHTLPIGGSARFASALSVDDFVKKTQYIYYGDDALEKVYKDVAAFARAEGLGAHAKAVEARYEDVAKK